MNVKNPIALGSKDFPISTGNWCKLEENSIAISKSIINGNKIVLMLFHVECWLCSPIIGECYGYD